MHFKHQIPDNTGIKVSVIIPAYNVAEYIGITIESCMSQQLKEIEIIVVDDGSTDETEKIIREYAEKDKRIIPIYKQNEGVTLTRKRGLEIASGKYIFFLDGDDYIPKNALKVMYYQALLLNADFVVGDFILLYPDGFQQKKIFHNFKETDSIGFLKYCFKERDFYFTGRLIRRSFILSASLEIPHHITFGEDNIAVIQLGYQLKKAIKVNIPVLYYTQRSSSVTNQLKRYDLKQRGKACDFILKYAREKKIYDSIKTEIEIFVLKELCDSIARGYVYPQLKNYLKLPFIQFPYRSNLTYKELSTLLLAKISTNSSIILYSKLKSLNKIWSKNG